MNQTVLFNDDTLSLARQRVMANLDIGSRCPCCLQLAKRYRRRLYSGIAVAFIYFGRLSGEERAWVSTRELLKSKTMVVRNSGRADFAKLAHWGLIEERPNEVDADKRTSGIWRLTVRGLAFLNLKVKVSSHVLLYDGKLKGFSGIEVSLDECLGRKFSYSELMG